MVDFIKMLFPEEWADFFRHKGIYDRLNKELYFILKNLEDKSFFPERKKVLRAFKDLMPKDVKVVVLGMDPYPSTFKGEDGPVPYAIGRAFAVEESAPIPASLRVIMNNSALDDLDKQLDKWVEQGVFLLNTALTVEEKSPGSHIKLWSNFSKLVIQALAEEKVYFLLLGKEAQKLSSIIVSDLPDQIVTDVHPAATCYNPKLYFGEGFSKIYLLTNINL